MAQLLTAGALGIVGTIAGAGVIYFQPHSVIALLVKGFPRIIWCLSHVSPPLGHNASRRRSATDTPFNPSQWSTSKGWVKFQRRLKVGRRRATKLYGIVVEAIGSAVASASSGLRGAYAEPGSDTELQEYHFEEGEDEEDDELELAVGTGSKRGIGPRIRMDGGDPVLDGVEAQPSGHDARGEERLPGVSAPVVALTIDDSPSIYSAEMLDILKENGKLDDGDAVLSRMVREGHELGNHTWYDRPTIRLPTDVFEQELLKVDALITKHDTAGESDSVPHLHITGEGVVKRTRWFRPGQGWFTHEMCDIAERHGYRTVLGCRFPLDTASPDPQLNAWHVIQGNPPWIKQTLRILLPALVQMGYKLYRLACVGAIGITEEEDATSPHQHQEYPPSHQHHHHHHHQGSGCDIIDSPAPPLPPRRLSSDDIRLSRSM
ncbi:hypothetical protein BC829DRAFT_381253, partial [Chytridium lagenaria]